MNQQNSVLVISEDNVLFENIRANNPLDCKVDHLKLNDKRSEGASDVQHTQAHLGSDQLAILILDMATIPRAAQHDTIKQFKAEWPRASLIVTGNTDDINHALEPSVQPLIYRAFKTPVSVKQLALSLEPALGFFQKHSGAVSESTRGTSQPTPKSDSNRSVVLIGFGVAALCVAGWYFLFNQTPEQTPDPNNIVETQENENDTGNEAIVDSTLDETERTDNLDTSDKIGSTETAENTAGNDIDLTVDLGELALQDGRLISPAKDNAAYYFDLALDEDPYNNRAYSGSKQLADKLLQAYPQMISVGDYVNAYAHLDAYQKIAPLDRSLESHFEKAAEQVADHFQSLRDSSNADALASARTQYEALAGRLDNDSTMESILETESKSSAQIESALTSGNLFPPTKGNAYSLLRDAIGNKTISRSTHEGLLERLETAFVKSAQAKSKLTDLNADQSNEVRELLKNGRLLGVKSPLLDTLEERLASYNKNTISKDETSKAEVADRPTIAPAKLLSRAAAKYPSRALDRGIEGWVEVSFQIDTEGRPVKLKVTNSKPAKVFDSAAMNAVRDWKFLPAMDMETGSAVETLDKSTRMHFKIEG